MDNKRKGDSYEEDEKNLSHAVSFNNGIRNELNINGS